MDKIWTLKAGTARGRGPLGKKDAGLATDWDSDRRDGGRGGAVPPLHRAGPPHRATSPRMTAGLRAPSYPLQRYPRRSPRPGAPPPEGACARGLLDIELADPGFDRDRFLGGARTAYEIVQKAYGDADRLALRPLLSDEVYGAFERAIAAPSPGRAGSHDQRSAMRALSGRSLRQARRYHRGVPRQFHRARRRWCAKWRTAGALPATIGAADPNWILVATAGDPA